MDKLLDQANSATASNPCSGPPIVPEASIPPLPLVESTPPAPSGPESTPAVDSAFPLPPPTLPLSRAPPPPPELPCFSHQVAETWVTPKDVRSENTPELRHLTTEVSDIEIQPELEPVSRFTMEEIEALILKAEKDAVAESVGLHLLPRQRRDLAAKKGGTFNMIVAGASGLGKSTFINTLFGTDILPQPDGAPGPAQTTLILIHKVQLEEQGFLLDLTVVDTPGFGDHLNNNHTWVPIVEHIDEQLRLYLFQQEQPDRSKMVDTRIHCCLYFISPTGHALSPLDLAAMRELGKRVNLLPVLAKSDAYLKAELQRSKERVRGALTENRVTLCELLVTGEQREIMPFSVIGAEPGLEGIRGRRYRWGVAEVENPDHCDFVELRELLLGEGMLDLILSTERFCEHYRRHLLKFRLQLAARDPEEAASANRDGIQALKVLSRCKLSELERQLQETSPVFLDKQAQMRLRFTDIVNGQETKFKEWKTALFERQKHFNQDIEATHTKVLRLTETIKRLESGPDPRIPGFTLRESISTLEI